MKEEVKEVAKESKVPVMIRFDQSDFDLLKSIADKQDRSVAYIVKKFVKSSAAWKGAQPS